LLLEFVEVKNMLTNEHTIDRIVRIVIGLVLLSLVFIGPQTMWGLLGLVPLVTGAIGFCPLYKLVGVSTCARGSHATR
jgi:hypothetical protein